MSDLKIKTQKRIDAPELSPATLHWGNGGSPMIANAKTGKQIAIRVAGHGNFYPCGLSQADYGRSP